jgi:hypothetical protein
VSLSSCDFLAPKTLHCFVSAEAFCGCDTGAVIVSSGPPTYSNSLNSGASSTLRGDGSAPSNTVTCGHRELATSRGGKVGPKAAAAGQRDEIWWQFFSDPSQW